MKTGYAMKQIIGKTSPASKDGHRERKKKPSAKILGDYFGGSPEAEENKYFPP